MRPNRPDRVGIVQFIHPGKEQTAVHHGWCAWNSATRSDKAWPHRRKFLSVPGSYLFQGRAHEGLVGLWGEWEGPSLACPITARRPGEPRFCHSPVLYTPRAYDGLLDTDPCVFGERFLYCGCQQHTLHHRPGGAVETFLRRLDRGSLILFGSHIAGRFVVDTVFVIAECYDYPSGEFESLAGLVPPEYYALSLWPQAKGNDTCDSFRLYRGATLADPVEGMYSFVPCRPFDGHGFVRPVLDLPCVTHALTQGKRFTPSAASEIVTTWREVRRQVESAGLALAHRLVMSPLQVSPR